MRRTGRMRYGASSSFWAGLVGEPAGRVASLRLFAPHKRPARCNLLLRVCSHRCCCLRNEAPSCTPLPPCPPSHPPPAHGGRRRRPGRPRAAAARSPGARRRARRPPAPPFARTSCTRGARAAGRVMGCSRAAKSCACPPLPGKEGGKVWARCDNRPSPPHRRSAASCASRARRSCTCRSSAALSTCAGRRRAGRRRPRKLRLLRGQCAQGQLGPG